MSAEKETPANSSSCQTTQVEWIRPFDVAALAMAMHRENPKGSIDGPGRETSPKDYIEDAYELLMEAERVLARRHKQYHKGKALDDHYEVAQLDKTYSWKELLTIQVKAPPGKGSLDKFCPGKNWRRLVADHKSGRTPFTNDDLVNRPVNFTMIGNVTSNKQLRKTIRRCFGTSAEDIIALKALSVEQINEILINQLMHYKGAMPKAKEPKISGG